MFYTFPPEFGIVMAIIFVLFLVREGLKKAVNGLPSKNTTDFKKPFIELDVKPVSEGDEVGYAYEHDGKYEVHVKNKRKKASLYLEAESIEELTWKVKDTFRAWSITGKKEPGRA